MQTYHSSKRTSDCVSLTRDGRLPITEVISPVEIRRAMSEDLTLANIHAARTAYETTDLPKRLRRYHRNVDATFWGWNNIWLSETFRDWNIEAMLPSIDRVPAGGVRA